MDQEFCARNFPWIVAAAAALGWAYAVLCARWNLRHPVVGGVAVSHACLKHPARADARFMGGPLDGERVAATHYTQAAILVVRAGGRTCAVYHRVPMDTHEFEYDGHFHFWRTANLSDFTPLELNADPRRN